MAVSRYKKPKNSKNKPLTKADIAWLKEKYLNKGINLVSAALVRTLFAVYDWDKSQLDEFCESMNALMRELTDERTTAQGFIRDTKELTGVDVTILWK